MGTLTSPKLIAPVHMERGIGIQVYPIRPLRPSRCTRACALRVVGLPSSALRRRSVRIALATLVVAASGLASAAAADAVSDPPAKLTEGASFTVKDPGRGRGKLRLLLS